METNSRSSSYFLHLLPRESIFRSELLPIRGRRIDFWDSSRSHSTFVSKTEKKLEKNKKTRKEKRRRILIVNAAMNPVFGEGGKEGEYQSWNERFPKIKKKERKKWTNGNRLALVRAGCATAAPDDDENAATTLTLSNSEITLDAKRDAARAGVRGALINPIKRNLICLVREIVSRVLVPIHC